MEQEPENQSASEVLAESQKRARMISRLAHEMLDVCRGLSVRVVKEALQEAMNDCDSRSVLSGRSFPDSDL